MNLIPEYKIKEIYPDTYAISDPGIGIGEVFLYLLVGKDKALLIDSGYGLLDLKGIVRSITDKDVICVCTHGHIDHALGACQFENSYLHSRDFEVYDRHKAPDFIRSVGFAEGPMYTADPVRSSPFHRELVERLAASPHPALKPLDNISAFDLGNRTVSCHLLPGHTQGSAVFYDRENHVIFDSDAAPVGVWIFLPESSPIPRYIDTLENYREFLLANRITARYSGHTVMPLTVRDLDALIACCRRAQREFDGGIPFSTPFGDTQIFMDESTAVFAPSHT